MDYLDVEKINYIMYILIGNTSIVLVKFILNIINIRTNLSSKKFNEKILIYKKNLLENINDLKQIKYLDNVNIEKINNYLKKRSSQTDLKEIDIKDNDIEKNITFENEK